MKRTQSRPVLNVNLVDLALSKLDDPFSEEERVPPEEGIPVLNLNCVVPSPLGDELVDPKDCEHPTRRMDADEIKRMLKECNPQQAKTIRAMKAVIPPPAA